MNLQCVLYMLVKTRSFCVHRLSAARDQSRPTSHSLQTLPTFKGSYLHTQEGCHHISTYFMNLHCFFYTPVKTRSLYRSSLECSNGSKSTYSTQLTKIAQLQRLIAPKPRGCHPHKCCLNEAPMLLLWCNPSPKSVGHCVMELQAFKVTLFW